VLEVFSNKDFQGSSPLLDVLIGRPNRIVRRREIALMKDSHLVLLERADDCVQHATVMEQDQVFLPPDKCYVNHEDTEQRKDAHQS
jgi:hypothetical protein